MAPRCPRCNSTDIDTDASRGDTACTSCGYILGENNIVSEIGFSENSNGSSSVVGQFVPITGSKGLSSSAKLPSSSSGYGRESREATLANGKRHIRQLVAQLHLTQRHVEAAERYFGLAVQHNFIQGRRTQNVVAACLYAACRFEKAPHMLIDFSDALQTNLYVLGSTFLKFMRLLGLRLPIVDPSLYIHRFASKLEFGPEKTHAVAMTALRLVASMKRDWIQLGRRPAGICGACLLISARLHGFRRTQREIINVVRICDVTLRKRLDEFCQTSSADLTFDQFEALPVDLDTDTASLPPARDPPAFLRNRALEEQQENALIESKKMVEKQALVDAVMQVLEHSPALQQLDREASNSLVPIGSKRKHDDLTPSSTQTSTTSSQISSSQASSIATDPSMSQPLSQSQSSTTSIDPPSSHSTSTLTTTPDAPSSTSTSTTTPDDPSSTSDPTDGPIIPESFDDLDDAELDEYIVPIEEVEFRTKIWEEIHADYLEKQAEKKKMEEELAASGETVKRKYKPKKKSVGDSAASSTANVLAEKKLSNKINHQALHDLMNESGLETKKRTKKSKSSTAAGDDDGRLGSIRRSTSLYDHDEDEDEDEDGDADDYFDDVEAEAEVDAERQSSAKHQLITKTRPVSSIVPTAGADDEMHETAHEETYDQYDDDGGGQDYDGYDD